jgi:hypothetical protein
VALVASVGEERPEKDRRLVEGGHVMVSAGGGWAVGNGTDRVMGRVGTPGTGGAALSMGDGVLCEEGLSIGDGFSGETVRISALGRSIERAAGLFSSRGGGRLGTDRSIAVNAAFELDRVGVGLASADSTLEVLVDDLKRLLGGGGESRGSGLGGGGFSQVLTAWIASSILSISSAS